MLRTFRISSSSPPPPLAPMPPRRCCRSSSSPLVAAAAAADKDDAAASPSSSKDVSEDVWATKPIWCRPYSIVATGVFVVGGAKVVGGTWLALAAAAAISVWWWAFLVEYPAAYRDYVKQAGTKQTGVAADSEEI